MTNLNPMIIRDRTAAITSDSVMPRPIRPEVRCALASLRRERIETLHDYALDASAIGHIDRMHGDTAVEKQRGQCAVTAADYARLPQLLNAPDSVEDAGNTEVGRPGVRISKQFGTEMLVAVFEVRAGRRMLVPVTMYVRKKN